MLGKLVKSNLKNDFSHMITFFLCMYPYVNVHMDVYVAVINMKE